MEANLAYHKIQLVWDLSPEIPKTLDGKIDDTFNTLEKRFDSLEKNFDRQNTLIIACIAIPMALIPLMIAWRSVKDTSLQKQMDTLSEIIDSQKQQLAEKSSQS